MDRLSLEVLNLQHFPTLMNFLGFANRKAVAIKLLNAVIDANSPLDTPELMDSLLTAVAPLIKDGDDTPAEEADSEDFKEEQRLVSRVVNQIRCEETDTLFRIYSAARVHFSLGGMRRIQFTMVPLTFRYLDLARAVFASSQAVSEDGETAVNPQRMQAAIRKIFQLVHDIVTSFNGIDELHDLEHRLYLQCALAADHCQVEAIAYEFMTRAFALYEDMADSRLQSKAIDQMIGTLHMCRNFDEENYDTLITKVTQYSAKLLKKPEQCRKVYRCAHLFWTGRPIAEDGTAGEPAHGDDKRALECLQRSLKIADVCMEASLHVRLFLEILNRYIYFFEQNAPKVEARYLQSLVVLVKEHLSNLDDAAAKQDVMPLFRNTLGFIQRQQQEGNTRYEGIDAGF